MRFASSYLDNTVTLTLKNSDIEDAQRKVSEVPYLEVVTIHSPDVWSIIIHTSDAYTGGGENTGSFRPGICHIITHALCLPVHDEPAAETPRALLKAIHAKPCYALRFLSKLWKMVVSTWNMMCVPKRSATQAKRYGRYDLALHFISREAKRMCFTSRN